MADPEQKNPTRERILSAAQRLFHQRSFNQVGINALCKEAGVVKGSFYHFFSGKQALLDAVIERNRECLVENLKALETEIADGRSRVLAQFTLVLESAAAQQTGCGHVLGCNIGALASELAVTNEAARAAGSAAFKQWRAVLQEWVRQGIEDGSIAPTVDPAATAIALLAVLQGMSTLGRTFNDTGMLAEIAATAVKRLLPLRMH